MWFCAKDDSDITLFCCINCMNLDQTRQKKTPRPHQYQSLQDIYWQHETQRSHDPAPPHRCSQLTAEGSDHSLVFTLQWLYLNSCCHRLASTSQSTVFGSRVDLSEGISEEHSLFDFTCSCLIQRTFKGGVWRLTRTICCHKRFKSRGQSFWLKYRW